MPPPTNALKARLGDGPPMLCLWLGLANAYVAELSGRAGFDCVVVDGEHGPNDIPTITAQLQVLAGTGTPAAVRLPVGEPWLIKQALDAGAQTLIIPMVETAEEAARLVAATRYPPAGIRGVGAALGRASDWGRIGDYLTTAEREICLLLQIESAAALDQIEAIAAVDGVDGLFVGPSDLAASMGHLGNPGAAEVGAAIEDALRRIGATGKAAAIFASDPEMAAGAMRLGARLVAVGADATLYARAAQDLYRQAAAARDAMGD
ncbi:MAG: HpcH/HpaI aldolase/citrate lyase family protein [Pseudomonadota bacterium]